MSIATPYRFSVNQYECLLREGIVRPQDGLELIQGQLLKKWAGGEKHAAAVDHLARQCRERCSGQTLVVVGLPLALPDSEPESDVVLLKPKADDCASGRPRATDALLIIEVADTSQEYDRDVKMRLYAQNGVREFWLADVTNEKIEVYRQPMPMGKYASIQVLEKGQKITIEALPGVEFEVVELLP